METKRGRRVSSKLTGLSFWCRRLTKRDGGHGCLLFFNFNSFNFTKKRLGSKLGSLVHLASLLLTVAHLLVPLIGLVQFKVLHDLWQPIMIEHRQKQNSAAWWFPQDKGLPPSLPSW